MDLHVGPAESEDWPGVIALLSRCDLPTEDVSTESLGHFLLARVDGNPGVIGVVGLEPYGTVGLLRSLAVAEEFRGRSVARALVGALERRALREGIEQLFLLTTTAAPYFNREGYEHVDRSVAPDPIRATREFADLCPDSAIFMRKTLQTA